MYNITKINYDEKDKWINKNISTFPQIYLKKKDSNGSLLLGGFDDINKIYNLIDNKENNLEKKIDSISKLFPNINRKPILRIIELLNNKIS